MAGVEFVSSAEKDNKTNTVAGVHALFSEVLYGLSFVVFVLPFFFILHEEKKNYYLFIFV